MRPLLCTQLLKRGVDRADERGTGGQLEPGVVALRLCEYKP